MNEGSQIAQKMEDTDKTHIVLLAITAYTHKLTDVVRREASPVVEHTATAGAAVIVGPEVAVIIVAAPLLVAVVPVAAVAVGVGPTEVEVRVLALLGLDEVVVLEVSVPLGRGGESSSSEADEFHSYI